MKRLLVVAAGILAVTLVARNTPLGSYVRTAWDNVRHEARNSVPSHFELDRIRGEIANLDRDIEGMVNPLASDMTDLQNLRAEIKESQTTLQTGKERLLEMTSTLERGDKLVIAGITYNGDHARARLQQDFAAFKRLEEKLDTQQKLLEAREERFEAALAQAEKLMSKKREYEVRLARVEAEEERLQIERIGCRPHVDNNRASQIEEALRFMENRHRTERNATQLRKGPFCADPETGPAGSPEVDLDQIRHHLERSGTDGGRLQDIRTEVRN